MRRGPIILIVKHVINLENTLSIKCREFCNLDILQIPRQVQTTEYTFY